MTRDDLEWPDAEDPRELRAQRQQLLVFEQDAVEIGERWEHQRARSTEALEGQRACSAKLSEALEGQRAKLSDVRREYEASLSWQVTRPLRAAGRMVRSFRSHRSR